MTHLDARFDDFVAANAAGLLSTAYLIVWDEAEAEDLVQECLLKVARRWPRVQKMDAPLAYTRQVLVNLALDGARRRNQRVSELTSASSGVDGSQESELSDLNAEAAINEIDSRAELFDALAQLSPRQRSVLVLRYFTDLSEEQTAKLLGCGTGTVKSSASRGLARLREILDGSEPPSTTSKSKRLLGALKHD